MKKFFAFVAVAIFALSMNAKQVVFDFSSDAGIAALGITKPDAGKGTNLTSALVLDGVTLTPADGSTKTRVWNSSGNLDLRVYASGGSLTFSAEEDITTIDVVGTAVAFSEIAEGTSRWQGEAAKSVKLTATATSKITKITVWVGETPGAEKIDTLTVAQAIAIADTLKDNASSEKKYYVEGYVVYADPYSPTYKNQIFFMSDNPAVKDSTFEAYGALPKLGKDTLPLVDGDKVRAFGLLKKYIDTKNGNKKQLELVNPAVEVLDTVPGADRSIPEVPTITVDSALKIGATLADNATTTEEYIIEGYVAGIHTFFNSDFKNENLFIADDPAVRTLDPAKAFEIYRGKPNTKVATGLGAKVKIRCKIKQYKGTVENDGSSGTPFDVLEPSTFVPDTLTVEEAVEVANAVSAVDAKTDVYYVVKGFVNSVTSAYVKKYNNASFTLAQFPNETEGALTAFQALVLNADSAKVKTTGAAPSDLYVNVTGYLTKHGSPALPQIASGAITAFVEAPNMDTIRVDAATALADGLALAVGAKSDHIYAVTDIVSSAEDEDEGLQSFSMADDFFEAYLAHVEEPIAAGNKVEVVGRLKRVDEFVVQIEGGKARIIYPEGIENIELTEKAQKVVVDGAVYIIRDNKMFNIHGAQVR